MAPWQLTVVWLFGIAMFGIVGCAWASTWQKVWECRKDIAQSKAWRGGVKDGGR